MRRLLYLAALSVVATLAFASVAMAQQSTYATSADSTDKCSGAREKLLSEEGVSSSFLNLHLGFVPDVGGCVVFTLPPQNPPLNTFGRTVYDPDTGEKLGLVKDLDPDLTSGSVSTTYQEFCGAFPTRGDVDPVAGETLQEYFEQSANAKEKAILDPDGDGQACNSGGGAGGGQQDQYNGGGGGPGSGGPGGPGGGGPSAGGMQALPNTGGPSLLLPLSALLMGSGILGLFVAIRRRA